MPTRRELANAIRALSMDAVQQAKSGHPGMPMGMADIAEVLWNDYLKHNPDNPRWYDRDRFVLSNGHGSMLHYSLLHLTGYALPIEEIRNFRQLHSMTPGHPEHGLAPGIETTTGPLGQGLCNAVGMAIAERVLGAQFNREGHEIVDHRTYVFLGDGCLMEGVSHEACSLAGTLGLGKLIAFYDDNGISIDGEVEAWFSDDTPKRFESYGWHVVPDVDGHDPEAIGAAIDAAIVANDRPTLICCRTIIGWGSPNKQGKESSHGAPLGDDEVALVRETIGWSHDKFVIPQAIYDAWNGKPKGGAAESAWNQQFAEYTETHTALASEFERRMDGNLPEDFEATASAYIEATQEAGENIASRKASQNCLDTFGPKLPELIGGSADLAASNLTIWAQSRPMSKDVGDANYIYYGVREFAMTAINNGIALHGGLMPYGATFLTFSDYARNAVRMAALMKIRNVQVYTHDSIGLGEDGPTHQSIEHAASLRLIPNLSLWRPCDTVESAVAWKAAIQRDDGPTCLLFTRQTVPHQPRDTEQLKNISRGGYVLNDCDGSADVLLIATGSEVGLAVDAKQVLEKSGINARVVSMPCTDKFDAQAEAYKESVLPSQVKARVAIEAGVSTGWYKYVGTAGRVVGIDTFGESAPAPVVFEYFGFTVDNVVKAAREAVAINKQ